MNANKSSNEQKNAPKSFTFVNKPSFTAIPNPVQLFLPRHYSSQSCPTFSPFQTSTFSPFTSNSRKSPVVEQAGWKHFFPSEKNSFGGSPSPYVSCAFLPFNSAASPSSICNSKKSQMHEMIISSDWNWLLRENNQLHKYQLTNVLKGQFSIMPWALRIRSNHLPKEQTTLCNVHVTHTTWSLDEEE